jgi:hypothetical protein
MLSILNTLFEDGVDQYSAHEVGRLRERKWRKLAQLVCQDPR